MIFFSVEKFLHACDELGVGLGRWTGWQSFYYRVLAGLNCWLGKPPHYIHTHWHTNTRVYTQACSSGNLNRITLGSMSHGRTWRGSCLTRLLEPSCRQRLNAPSSEPGWFSSLASLLSSLSTFGESYQVSTQNFLGKCHKEISNSQFRKTCNSSKNHALQEVSFPRGKRKSGM